MATRGRPFPPGNRFGRGRPRGSRNKASHAVQELLDQHAESLVRKCLVDAFKGDKQAMRLCLERLLPPRRERSVRIAAAGIGTAAEVAQEWAKIWKSMGKGQCTPGEAGAMTAILEGRRRVLETQELERRLQRLEGGEDAS